MREAFFITIILFLALDFSFGYDQDSALGGRDEIIFNTLNQLQDRQRQVALEFAMVEAQTKITNLDYQKNLRKYKEHKGTNSFLSNLQAISQRIHPYLTTNGSYTDNYDNSRSPRKSEVSLGNNLGARLNFFTLGENIGFDIHVNDSRTRKHPSANSEDMGASISSGISLAGWVFSFSDTMTNNYIATPEAGIKVDNLQRQLTNTINLGLNRSFNRIGFGFNYNQQRTYNKKNKKENDTLEETYGLSTSLRVAPKTRLSWDYEFNRPRPAYANDPDFEKYYNNLSLAWSVSPKLSFSVGTDYTYTDGKTEVDSSQFEYLVDIGYTLSPRTNISLGITHGRSYSKMKSENSLDTAFVLGINHRLARFPKLNTSFNFGADFKNFPKKAPQEERDSSYTYALTLDYAFKTWLDFGLSFSHNRDYSNSGVDNVYSNEITLSSQARF